MTVGMMMACTGSKTDKGDVEREEFTYVVDQFADIQVLRYQVPGFESLLLNRNYSFLPTYND
jgi:dipeptidyl-peptidase-3